MKLFIRYQGLPFNQIELETGKVYRIGRHSDAEIHLSAHEVPRKFGEVRFENEHWYFFYHEKDKSPVKLTEQTHVATKYGLEVGLASYLDQESTYVGFKASSFHSRKWAFATAVCASFTFAFGFFYGGQTETVVLNSRNLMKFAEDRIVKFELKIKDNYREELKADANLNDDDFKSSIGFCTGFAVAKNIILTAQHCVVSPPGFEILKDFLIKSSDGREIKPVKILSMDYLQDYLFLEVEDLDNSRSFEFARNFEIGEKVFTIGNVSGEGLALRDGIISGETEDINDPTIKHIRFSAAASPGNSGGPLLNSRGEIVALVSRKNMSENYNIGIHFRDLKRERDSVVNDKVYKTTQFNSKYSDLNITTISALANRTFGIKFPDFIFSRTDLADKFKNFTVDIPMPIDISSPDSELVLEKKFAAAFKELSDKLTTEATNNNLPGLTWESQVTKDFPVIIPGVHDISSISFRKISKNQIVPVELGLYGHSGFFGYDDALQKYRKNRVYKYPSGTMALKGSLVEQRIPHTEEKGYLVYSSAKDSDEPLDFSKMFYESPDFSVSFLKNMGPQERETIVIDTFEKILFGNNGAIVSLRFFPYVRPKAKTEFKLKTFQSDLSKIDSIKDSYGRDWNYYVSSFYGTFYVELFCTNNLQSTHCLTSFREGEFFKDKSLHIENFVFSELGEKFPLTEYFQTQDLAALNASLSKNPLLNDFTVEINSKHEFIVKTKKTSQHFNFGRAKQIQSVRFIPAIKKDPKSDNSSWMGYAAHVIKQNQNNSEVCAQGIDPELYAYHDFLNKNSGGNNLNRKPASLKTSVNYIKAKPYFNVCVPLTNFSNDEKILDLNFQQKQDR